MLYANLTHKEKMPKNNLAKSNLMNILSAHTNLWAQAMERFSAVFSTGLVNSNKMTMPNLLRAFAIFGITKATDKELAAIIEEIGTKRGRPSAT